MWFHKFLSDRGYCNPDKPRLKKMIGKKDKVYFYYKFNTWSSGSFNWIYDAFYTNNIKRVPSNIDRYLTPFALAIWIMDDGGADVSGLRLCTYSFT
jgi:hypothetical protein